MSNRNSEITDYYQLRKGNIPRQLNTGKTVNENISNSDQESGSKNSEEIISDNNSINKNIDSEELDNFLQSETGDSSSNSEKN